MGNARQMSGITPSLSGITSLSFFKQFDWIFPAFAILSNIQPIYSLSRSQDTGNMRPLNKSIAKLQGGGGKGSEEHVPHWWLCVPSRTKACWSPFPLRPNTDFRSLQKPSDFTPSRGSWSKLGLQTKSCNGPLLRHGVT